MISASCLCLVETQAGRSLFRRIRIFQFFALISSFFGGFRWVNKSGALIFNNASSRALDFQELARASGVARQSLTLELKGSP
jgi:zona occludens toxin (predicted ATPase)